MDGDGLWDPCRAGRAASPVSVVISRASPANPSIRSRTFIPSVPMSTRSTRSATMRPCSAGKSSPHRGSSCCSASRASASAMSPSCTRAAFQVPATISGWRNTARNWAMTAASISAVGTISNDRHSVELAPAAKFAESLILSSMLPQCFAQRCRHRVSRASDRICGEVGIARRGLHLRVAKQLADHG